MPNYTTYWVCLIEQAKKPMIWWYYPLNDRIKAIKDKPHASQEIQAKFWWIRRRLAMMHTPIAAIRAPIFPNKSAILGNAFWRKSPANETAKLIKTAAPKRCVKNGGDELGVLMNKAKTAWKVRPRIVFPRLFWVSELLAGGGLCIMIQIGKLLIPGFLSLIAVMKEWNSFIFREICCELDSIGNNRNKNISNELCWTDSVLQCCSSFLRGGMECSRI